MASPARSLDPDRPKPMASPTRPRKPPSAVSYRDRSRSDASDRARQARSYRGADDPDASEFVQSCTVQGDGLRSATVRQEASFKITVGEALRGDEAFFVSIRGASRVRAKVEPDDESDEEEVVVDEEEGEQGQGVHVRRGGGRFVCRYRPECSGDYTIAVSLYGVPLPGSPFALHVIAPRAVASMSAVSGPALTEGIARAQLAFDVRFRDALGQTAYAEDLDVFLLPAPAMITSSSGSATATADEAPPSLSAMELRRGAPQPYRPDLMSEEDSYRGSQRDGDAGGGGGGAKGEQSLSPLRGPKAASPPQSFRSNSPPPSFRSRSPTASRPAPAKKAKPVIEAPAPAPPPGELPSFLNLAIEVGDKPLIVRASHSLESPIVGQLPEGKKLRVLEEKVNHVEGTVRALIEESDPHAGKYAVLDSWFTPVHTRDTGEELAAVIAEAVDVAGRLQDYGINSDDEELVADASSVLLSPTYAARLNEATQSVWGSPTDPWSFVADTASERSVATPDTKAPKHLPIESVGKPRSPQLIPPHPANHTPAASLSHRSASPSHLSNSHRSQRSHRSEQAEPAPAAARLGHAVRRLRLDGLTLEDVDEEDGMPTSTSPIARGPSPPAPMDQVPEQSHEDVQLAAATSPDPRQASPSTSSPIEGPQAPIPAPKGGQQAQEEEPDRAEPNRSTHFGPEKGSPPTQPSRLSQRGPGALSSQRSHTSYSAAPSHRLQAITARSGVSTQQRLTARALASARPSGVGPNVMPTRRVHGLVGWVTLVKAHVTLVNGREKLDAGKRHLHLEQWARRQRTDRNVGAYKRDAEKALEKASEKSSSIGAKPKRLLDLNARASPFIRELESDPAGIGFAYGGCTPGVLHAHGALHEVHKVSYSVGKVGVYLLHVQLRQQATPLPGSPFTLRVNPAVAHASSSCFAPDTPVPLRGTVGRDPGCGVRCVVLTADMMRNWCDSGGAKVTATCTDETKAVECEVADNNDGTYAVHWRSQRSGTFDVAVMVDKVHITGSPTTITLHSIVPDLALTEVRGNGLDTLTAGETATISLRFLDAFHNVATPPQGEYTFGMSLEDPLVRDGLPAAGAPGSGAGGESGGAQQARRRGSSEGQNKAIGAHAEMLKALNRATPHNFEGSWMANGEEYMLTFRASTAGRIELLLWCVASAAQGGDPRIGERQPLPGSPFTITVNGGVVSAQHSELSAPMVERKVATSAKGGTTSVSVEEMAGGEVKAGETVLLRPRLLDAFNNQPKSTESALRAFLVPADGNEREVNVQTISRGGMAVHEVRHETSVRGDHVMRVMLLGTELRGSPVKYHVKPDEPDHSMIMLEMPSADEPGYIDQLFTFPIRTRDRFGNFLSKGGVKMSARLIYHKQSVHDQTTLTDENHVATVEDKHDGTYELQVELKNNKTKDAFTTNVEVQMYINVEMRTLKERERDARERRESGDQQRREGDLPAINLRFELLRPKRGSPSATPELLGPAAASSPALHTYLPPLSTSTSTSASASKEVSFRSVTSFDSDTKKDARRAKERKVPPTVEEVSEVLAPSTSLSIEPLVKEEPGSVLDKPEEPHQALTIEGRGATASELGGGTREPVAKNNPRVVKSQHAAGPAHAGGTSQPPAKVPPRRNPAPAAVESAPVQLPKKSNASHASSRLFATAVRPSAMRERDAGD